MLAKLPSWVVDDAQSVRDEVSEWKGKTEAERWQLAVSCARDAIWAASVSGMRERILERVDPLPESTRAALQRLRREAGWGREPH